MNDLAKPAQFGSDRLVHVDVRGDTLQVRGVGSQDMVDLLHGIGAAVVVDGADDRRSGTVEAAGLSERENEVVLRIGQGWSNAEIAAAMFLSINTIKSYIRSSYRKIGVQSTAQAVRWALFYLLEPEPHVDLPSQWTPTDLSNRSRRVG